MLNFRVNYNILQTYCKQTMKAFDCFRKREYFGFGDPCNIPEEHKQVSIKVQKFNISHTRRLHVEFVRDK